MTSLERLEDRRLLAGDSLVISELMAINDGNSNDSVADFSGEKTDWIEIHNPTATPVKVDGWYLTDDPDQLDKWTLPDLDIPADGYLLVFASGKNQTESEPHTNFKLDGDGEYLALVEPDGLSIAHQFSPQFPPQTADVSFGLTSEGQQAFFMNPTPGAANSDGFLGTVGDTRFSVDRGFFDEPFQLQIVTDTPDTNIRYTIDGSAPTESAGMLYAGPISIETTTTLRAAAFKTDYIPSDVDTQTYIFVDDVLKQPEQIEGFPDWSIDVGRPNWGSSTRQSIRLHYGMDPDVVDDPIYRDSIRESLLSIPTVSLVMEFDDVFGRRAFYNRGGSCGCNATYERPVSVEIIDPNRPEENVQVDAGVRPHSHQSLKRSLKLVFKSEYGDSKLKTSVLQTTAPLNGDSVADTFDRLILRGGMNRSFVTGWNPDDTTFTRDQWARDSQIAMSGDGSHGTFVHVYINGLYWGIYNVVERPDAFFNSTYNEGEQDDYFAINHGGNVSGDPSRWNYLVRNLIRKDMSIQANYEELKEYLDVEQFADYLLLNWYAGTSDWPQNNWYAGNRNLPEPSPIQFFVWDAEDTWDARGSSGIFDRPGGRGNDGAWVSPDFASEKTKFDGDARRTIAKIFHAARENPDFMVLFADRVYKHLFNNGALTVENSQARWQTLTAFVRDAIVAESARWGDARQTLPGERNVIRTRDDQWQAEADRVPSERMTGNVRRMIAALRADGYYPAFDPPTFSRYGGSIAAGSQLIMSSADDSADNIIVTLDGSDPHRGSVLVDFNSMLLDGTADARVLVPTDDSVDTTWSSLDFDDSNWTPGAASVGFDSTGTFDDLIETNIETEMRGINSSAYIRIPFDVDDPTSMDRLSLRMKYDDGFVVHLNGVEVMRENLRGNSLAWDSRARRARPGLDVVEFATFDLSKFVGVLRPGRNVLAIQAMNTSRGSKDLLVVPELLGGIVTDDGISPGAFTYGDPIELTQNTIVKARVFRAGQWSALAEAEFVIEGIPAGASNLRISEINYNPAGPSADEVFAGYKNNDDFEFIELTNISNERIDLSNVRLNQVEVDGVQDGVEFNFSTGSITRLDPGQSVLVVEDRDAFAFRYGSDLPITGQWTGGLSNRGELITLVSNGDTIHQFAYDDAWYKETDGGGLTLQAVDPSDPVLARWGQKEGWRASGVPGGTPGKAPSVPGDSNRDGLFDSRDLVLVFQAGEYEDGIPNNSTFEEGDWDGDGDFTTRDIVLALQTGAYVDQKIVDM